MENILKARKLWEIVGGIEVKTHDNANRFDDRSQIAHVLINFSVKDNIISILRNI